MKVLPIYTREEVKQHNTVNDCWIILNEVILNVTHFRNHPGSFELFMEWAGQDATAYARRIHGMSLETVDRFNDYVVGRVLSDESTLIQRWEVTAGAFLVGLAAYYI